VLLEFRALRISFSDGCAATDFLFVAYNDYMHMRWSKDGMIARKASFATLVTPDRQPSSDSDSDPASSDDTTEADFRRSLGASTDLGGDTFGGGAARFSRLSFRRGSYKYNEEVITHH
jgi:hypothetical protein